MQEKVTFFYNLFPSAIKLEGEGKGHSTAIKKRTFLCGFSWKPRIFLPLFSPGKKCREIMNEGVKIYTILKIVKIIA